MKITLKKILVIVAMLSLSITPIANNVSANSLKEHNDTSTKGADSKKQKNGKKATPFVSSEEQDVYAQKVALAGVLENAKEKLAANSTIHSKVGSSYTIDLGDTVPVYGEVEDWNRADGTARINSIKLNDVPSGEKTYGNFKVSVKDTSITVTRVSEKDGKEELPSFAMLDDLLFTYEWNVKSFGWYIITGWVQESDRKGATYNYDDKISLGSEIKPAETAVYETYLDEKDNAVSPQTIQEDLPYNTKYFSEPKDIPGYTLVKSPDNMTGIIEDDNAIFVNYIYKKDGPTLSFEKTKISNKTFYPSNIDEFSLKQVAVDDAVTITNEYIITDWNENDLVQEMLIPKHSNITSVELNGVEVPEENIVISDNNETTKKASIKLTAQNKKDDTFKLDVKLAITSGFNEKEQVILDKSQNILKDANNAENSVMSPTSHSLEMTTNTLSIDTGNIDFGTNVISAESVVLNRLGDSPVVKINDTRRSHAKTILTVSSDSFTNAMGAEIYYHDALGSQTTLNTPVTVMDEDGELPAEINWSKDEGLLLHVPSGAAMKGEYTNTLNWNILMIPELE